MNRKKFEKLKEILEKLEKNGYFGEKMKLKAFFNAMILRLRKNPFDILFWPFYFLHLFFVFIGKYFGIDNKSIYNFLIPGKIKNRIYEIHRLSKEKIFEEALNSLKNNEKKFIKNVFINTEVKVLFSSFHYIIIKGQYHAKEFIKDGDYVLDCGANIGIFSLYAAYLNEKGKIYAIEPVKETADIMQKLLDFFEVKNVKIIRKAVGDEKKKTYIHKPILPINLGGSTMLKISDNELREKEEIEVDTIDNIVKEEKIEKVDFIKMDIEGYERYALKGAVETIKKHKPIIVVSAYHLADDKKVLPEIVKSAYANYEVKLLKEGDEDFIFVPKRT